MTFDQFPTTRQLAVAGALGALAVVATTGVWLSIRGSDDGPPSDLGAPLQPTGNLEADWSADTDRQIEIVLDSARGPIWQLPETSIPLTPIEPESADVDWRRHQTDRGTTLIGRAPFEQGEFRAIWRFRPGDPQARLTIEVSDISVTTLRQQELTGTLEVPEGEFRASDRYLGIIGGADLELPHTISPWEPAWLEWHREDRQLAVRGWTGDGLSLTRSADGFEIAFDLWRPEAHGAVQRCQLDADSPPNLDLRATATFQFGGAPAIFPSRFPDRTRAAIAPIFDLPSAHPDTTLHRGSPNGPRDWAERARTLAFGHSNPEDPRYGNGGLLGHGLGGTIVVPAEWGHHEAVASFRENISDSALDVATRGVSSGEGRGFETLIEQEKMPCSSLVGADNGGLTVVADDTFPFRGTVASATAPEPDDASPRVSPPSTPFASSMSFYRLDGTRPQLVDDLLAEDSFDRLRRRRGLAVFATPLLGTRNPLIPAAKEALLSPERHGEWTLESSFASALVNLEITHETSSLAVRNTAGLVDHWRGARRAVTHWNHRGELLIRSSTEQTVEGFTLVFDGVALDADQVSVDGAKPTVETTDHTSGPGPPTPQTWISWDLAADETYRLSFGDKTSDLFDAQPVDWQIKSD